MNAHEFAAHLRDALESGDDAGVEPALAMVRFYDEVAMLTRDAGLLVRTETGDEFQVTVVQVRRGRDDKGGP